MLPYCKYLTFILLFAGSIQLEAQAYHFTYTSEGKEIYQDIIDLKLSSANEKLTKLFLSEPQNLSYLHLQSYLDFFSIFISEDEDQFKKAQQRKSKIIKTLEGKLSDEDPYKKFALAEVNLHSAISRSKFGQVFKSAKEILNAYNLLKSNQNAFPDFILNKKSLSVIHSLAETVSIPGIIKKIFGIKGTIAQGRSEIEEVVAYSQLNDNFLFKEEIDAIYLYILMYQVNDHHAVTSYLPKCRLEPSTSLLSTFMIAKIHQKLGQNDKAIAVLENKPAGSEYASFLYLDLVEGVCKLRNLDPTCTGPIQSFIEGFNGRHFVKEAYQKLAWAELVFHDNIANYKNHISKVNTGEKALVDDDKQAVRESKSMSIPDPDLLKARLLSDGGYHEKAYRLLIQKAYKYIDNNELEFDYRMGRICQALKNYPEAIEYYKETITRGSAESSYFACNAALQSGLIYESMNQLDSAEAFYRACLELKPEEYKSSLHQKALTGLMRLSEQCITVHKK